jgi:hypothetical protein
MQNFMWLMVEGLEDNEMFLLTQPWPYSTAYDPEADVVAPEWKHRFNVPLNNLKDLEPAFSRTRALDIEDGYQPFVGVQRHQFNDRLEKLWWPLNPAKVPIPSNFNPTPAKKFLFRNKIIWAYQGIPWQYKFGNTVPLAGHLPPADDMFLNENGQLELFELHPRTGFHATFRSIVFNVTDIVWDKAMNQWLDPSDLAVDFRGGKG